MPDDEPKPLPPAGDPLILPRRRAMPLRDAMDEDRSGELADLADSMKALSDRLAGAGAGGSSGGSGSGADPGAKTLRRWKRTRERELDEVRPAASRDAGNVPAPEAPARAVNQRKPARKMTRKPVRQNRAPVWIAGQAFCLGLIGLGYFFGQLGGEANPPPAPAPPTAGASGTPPGVRAVSEQAFQTVNRALASAKKGDAGEARQILEAAQRQDLLIPGLDYRLALLALQRLDLREAKLRLDCAMAAGEEFAACCYVRAMLAGAIGDYGRASAECSKSAHAAPFDARYLFFWAECLRRNGRLQPAIERFEEALNRPSSPADAAFIAFKLRLAKIEAGRTADFSAELTRRLATEPVDPRWLLTAAAMALEAGDAGGAAAQLQKASLLMPAADFDMEVRDYLLLSHSTEKEVAHYFRRGASPAARTPGLAAIAVDPVSWTIQAADPGAWPAASHPR